MKMLSTFKTKFSYSKIFISVFCAILFFAVLPIVAKADIVNVKGWAWSDTIGWIQFDTGKSSLPTYNTATGALSGYAWSDNIGWIKFNGLSANNGVGGSSAKTDTSTGIISGWARACAGTSSGDCTSMVSRSDGWDGWIKFDTGRSNPVKIDLVTGDFHGYAWGSDVVGWISFNCMEGSSGAGSVCGTSDYKVTIGNIVGVVESDRNLTVNIGGSGKGRIFNKNKSESISSSKTWLHSDNTHITLQATPDQGSRFGGWNNSPNTGNCTNSKGGAGVISMTDFPKDTCTIILDGANKTLSVTFELNNIPPSSSSSSSSDGSSSTANLSVIYAGSGTGSVSLQHMGSLDGNNNGFESSVPGSAPWDLAPNWTFMITATPGSNSSFASWSSNCDTSRTDVNGNKTCIITMDTDKVVTATFNCVSNCSGGGGGGGGGGNTLTVNVGNGTVTVVAMDGSSPTLTCSNFATCSQSYTDGTKLTLTESETGGEPFDRWTGDCSVSGGASVCNLTMDLSRTVGALFGGCACAGNSCTPCLPPPPPIPPVKGACGKAHKTNSKEAPSVNLCADGSTPPVSGTGPWTWTCLGSNGGTDAPCSSGKLEVIIQEI